MISLRDQVCSSEQSEQLRELGFFKPSCFRFEKNEGEQEHRVYSNSIITSCEFPAYSSAELGAALAKSMQLLSVIKDYAGIDFPEYMMVYLPPERMAEFQEGGDNFPNGIWYIRFGRNAFPGSVKIGSNSEAKVKAAALIWLLENKKVEAGLI